ncbi:hypothetical protein KCU83_g431, partial [Aureobasidium melanogenum]
MYRATRFSGNLPKFLQIECSEPFSQYLSGLKSTPVAKVSPVPQFKARYTLPKAPLPRQSPSCCELLSARRPSTMFQAWQILSYVVFEACDLTSSSLYSPIFWRLFPTRWLVVRGRMAIGRLRALGDSRHGGKRV